MKTNPDRVRNAVGVLLCEKGRSYGAFVFGCDCFSTNRSFLRNFFL